MTDPATSAHAEPTWPAEPEPRRGWMNRPRRGLVALIELVFAAAASWGAALCWSQVVTTVTAYANDGTELTSRLYSGPWVAATIGCALLVALLVLEAIREIVLAWRPSG